MFALRYSTSKRATDWLLLSISLLYLPVSIHRTVASSQLASRISHLCTLTSIRSSSSLLPPLYYLFYLYLLYHNMCIMSSTSFNLVVNNRSQFSHLSFDLIEHESVFYCPSVHHPDDELALFQLFYSLHCIHLSHCLYLPFLLSLYSFPILSISQLTQMSSESAKKV